MKAEGIGYRPENNHNGATNFNVSVEKLTESQKMPIQPVIHTKIRATPI